MAAADGERVNDIPKYMYLVDRCANKLTRTDKTWHDDMISTGTVALWRAMQDHDESRDTSFVSFASFKIRAAMIDFLRSVDYMSRRLRAEQKQRAKITASLMQELQRDPTESEIEARMPKTEREQASKKWRMSIQRVSMDAPLPGDGNRIIADTVAVEDESERGYSQHEDRLERLADELKRLPPRMRDIVHEYYFEQHNLAKIAVRHGVTESRVSQICDQARSILRKRITYPQPKTP